MKRRDVAKIIKGKVSECEDIPLTVIEDVVTEYLEILRESLINDTKVIIPEICRLDLVRKREDRVYKINGKKVGNKFPHRLSITPSEVFLERAKNGA